VYDHSKIEREDTTAKPAAGVLHLPKVKARRVEFVARFLVTTLRPRSSGAPCPGLQWGCLQPLSQRPASFGQRDHRPHYSHMHRPQVDGARRSAMKDSCQGLKQPTRARSYSCAPCNVAGSARLLSLAAVLGLSLLLRTGRLAFALQALRSSRPEAEEHEALAAPRPGCRGSAGFRPRSDIRARVGATLT
jgi:hypothetical protein